MRASPPVFAIMVIWTGITLTAQTRGFLAQFGLIVGQHVVIIYRVSTQKNNHNQKHHQGYY